MKFYDKRGSFVLATGTEGPYVLLLGHDGRDVGSFHLTPDGKFKGSWHEKDPENPRKQYITSFPILKHIPIVDRLRELQPTPKKKRRKKA